jgi:putative ABC transport system substrate-binding protein
MRRREFIAALGGAAAWPLVARAEQPGMPVIGRILMRPASETDLIGRDAFARGLNEARFFNGRNVSIYSLSADGQINRLPALIADMIQRKVAVIYAPLTAALAAKAATSTIPIVFVTTTDPLAAGAIASFNRPGGNVTGVRLRAGEEGTKKTIELAHELVPTATTIGKLINPNYVDAESEVTEFEAAARSLGLKVVLARATSASEFEAAIGSLAEARVGALLLHENVMFYALRASIIAVAARYGLPIIASAPGFAVAGGLASYGADVNEVIRQAGVYIGRILKGDKPGDLPVVQPTTFHLVINLKTAKTLGLTIPPSLLARADEVIE